MSLRLEFELFQAIWSEKKDELLQWAYFNLWLGLAPVWLSWLVFIIVRDFTTVLEPLYNGSILIFAVTLTGASLGFFSEDTRRELSRTKRFVYVWMITLIIAASGAFAIMVVLPVIAPSRECYVLNGIISLVLFLVSVSLNMHLTALRIAYADEEFIKRLINPEVLSITEQAKRATSVDGVSL